MKIEADLSKFPAEKGGKFFCKKGLTFDWESCIIHKVVR